MATVQQRIIDGNEFVQGHIYALEQAQVRALYAAYEQAYQDMQAALAQAFNAVGDEQWNLQHAAIREALLRQIAQQMIALDQQAAAIMLGGLEDGLKAGVYGNAWILDNSLFGAMGIGEAAIPLLPTEAIRAQLLAPYYGQTFVDRFRDNRLEFEMAVKKALLQSQIQGEGIYQAQKRIAQALGVNIARRTKADRANNKALFARTEAIARTELLRASNEGAYAVYRANRDVLRGWEWTAAHDSRACPQCAALDGQVFEFESNQPRPPLHVRCRCAAVPALINRAAQDAIAGKRESFYDWAGRKGITHNAYGQAYTLRAVAPPKKKVA